MFITLDRDIGTMIFSTLLSGLKKYYLFHWCLCDCLNEFKLLVCLKCLQDLLDSLEHRLPAKVPSTMQVIDDREYFKS